MIEQLSLDLYSALPCGGSEMATTLDSAKKRMQEAQSAARKRATKENVGPEWPSVDGISLEEALEELTYAVLAHDARVSFGVQAGTADVWCRVALPLSCDHAHAGDVAFTSSSSIDRAARKAAQLLATGVTKVWQPDKFAR